MKTIFKQDVYKVTVSDKDFLHFQTEPMEKGLHELTLFNFYFDELLIGSFSLAPMPFCCGVVVMGNVYIRPSYRGSIHSEKFRKIKNNFPKMFGYSCVVATSQIDNPASYKNFKKVGYKEACKFVNSRTNNKLVLGYKIINGE